MKNIAILASAMALIILSSCGGEPEEEKIDPEENPLGALVKMSQNMAESAEKMEKKMKEGKVGEALAFEDLMKYLPESVSGYTISGEPTGAKIDMGGMSYSSAEIEFTNDAGENIHVTLLDYQAANSMYTMATAMWASGIKIDTPEERAESMKISDEVSGWESYQKKSKDASVVLGIGDRFLLTIEGGGQDDCEFFKDIAKDMDLNALAGLE